MSRVLVVLPCYNEAKSLPNLLVRLDDVHRQLSPEHVLRVLVVNDGSGDATAEIASSWQGSFPLELHQHPRNLGLGAALLAGIHAFLRPDNGSERADLLAVMDADGTHPPELLPRMIARASEAALPQGKPPGVVIASRFAPGGEEHGLTVLRRIYSRLACLALRTVAPLSNVRDYTCGYRLYHRAALEGAFAKYDDAIVTERSFACMAELLVKLGRSGATFAEVPLKLHYELKEGASKMNVPATIARYVALAWLLLFNRRWR